MKKHDETEKKSRFALSIKLASSMKVVVALCVIVPLFLVLLLGTGASKNVIQASAGNTNNLVGVQPGDWARYGISSKGPLGTSLGMAEGDHEWVRIDVQNVISPLVTFRETTHFKNGNETVDTITVDLGTDSAGMYIIAVNHTVGDGIYQEGSREVFINGTVSKSYLGVNREAYYSTYSFIAPFFDDWINGTLAYYWDRQTGLLLETSRSAAIIGYESTTLSRWSKEIIDTNLWKTNSQLSLSPLRSLTLLGIPLGITIAVTIVKRKEKTKRLGNSEK